MSFVNHTLFRSKVTVSVWALVAVEKNAVARTANVALYRDRSMASLWLVSGELEALLG